MHCCVLVKRKSKVVVNKDVKAATCWVVGEGSVVYAAAIRLLSEATGAHLNFHSLFFFVCFFPARVIKVSDSQAAAEDTTNNGDGIIIGFC